MMLLSRLRRWLRDYFSYVVYEKQSSVGETGVRAHDFMKPLINRRHQRRRRVVSPSERFVWGMVLLLVALLGMILLETIFIVVTGTINDDLIAGISALLGSLTTAFLIGKRS
jgi:hypothetical protein